MSQDRLHAAANPRRMKRYRITFADEGEITELSFETGDVKDVLALISEQLKADLVELWCEGKRLGNLQYLACDEGLFWRLDRAA